jgi:hypothetical protein
MLLCPLQGTLAPNELGTLGTVDSCIVAFIWVFAPLELHEELKV